MDMHKHHEELVKGFSEQLKPIFEDSGQGIYLYLDDEHLTCNKKFAAMLGYKSVAEWSKINGSFLDAFVAQGSQDKLVDSYRKTTSKMIATSANITWRKKDGKTFKADMIMVPAVFEGHLFALHFIG